MLEIINDNEEKILKNYSVEEKDDYINIIKNSTNNIYDIAIGKYNMNDLIYFIYNLIINHEIILAKKAFYISKRNNYIEKDYHFEYHLLESLLDNDDINFLKVIIDFVGEDEFIQLFDNIISIEGFNSDYLKLFIYY
jgi:hypothetical protein